MLRSVKSTAPSALRSPLAPGMTGEAKEERRRLRSRELTVLSPLASPGQGRSRDQRMASYRRVSELRARPATKMLRPSVERATAWLSEKCAGRRVCRSVHEAAVPVHTPARHVSEMYALPACMRAARALTTDRSACGGLRSVQDSGVPRQRLACALGLSWRKTYPAC